MDERTAIVTLACIAAGALAFEAGQQFERWRQRRKRPPAELPPDERKLRQGVCPICYGQKGTAFGDCGFCRATGRPPGIVTLTEEERHFLISAVPFLQAGILDNASTAPTTAYRTLKQKDFESIIGYFTRPKEEPKQ